MAPPVHNPDGDDVSLRDMVRDIHKDLKGIREDLKDHNKAIAHLMNWKTGGEKPANGIDIRMDRLERAHKSVGKVAWSAITGAGAALGGWLWATVSGKNG
jgi:hypothetical protein